MQDKIDIRQALRVYNKITERGHQQGNSYVLDGIIATAEFDGYTVRLHNDYASLDLYFHNKFAFQCASKQQKLLFLEKLNDIDRRR